MKTRDTSCPDEPFENAAAEWLCERAEGFTPERAQAFAEWRNRDPRHSAAVARVEQALALLDEMPAIRSPLESRFGSTNAAFPPAVSRRRAGRLLTFRLPALLAAVAASLVIGVVAWWSLSHRAAGSEHYATDAAAQRRVELRDGSLVDINRASDVRVQFSARERRVSLNAGEAHFQVAADVARPFVVTAGGVKVRAVGTAFTVRLSGESVEVLVMEGKVELIPADAPPADASGARALLVAGERTQISRDVPAAAKVEKAEPESIRAALAWQDPMTTFNDVPLREVIARLNQRNTTQLVLEDAQLAGRKIGGVIALDQVEAFVRLLEQDGDVAVERRSATEIRLRRAR